MKWGIELLLGFLCILLFLFIGKQLLKEPFADLPTPEIYDIQLFFKSIPFSQICEVWLAAQSKLFLSFQADEKGMPLPQDIIQQKVNSFLKKEIPTGPLQCPFTFPDSNDLDTVHSFVMKLKNNLLEQAHRTLVFCAVQSQKDLTNSKNALSTKNKSIEGFITECTPTEILLKNSVPLQCIDPAVMKASEKEIIVKDSDHARKQKLKKEIAEKLFALQKNFDEYLASAKKSWAATLDSSRKNLAAVEMSIEILKKKENEEDASKLQQLGEQKVAITNTIQTATSYIMFLPISYTEILDKTNKNIAEIKQLEKDVQSGKISFTS
jgi:hypothetical protein